MSSDGLGISVKTRLKYFRSRINVWDYAGELPPVKRSNGIPRMIHQTFPRRTLPGELRENMLNIKNLNPEWEYKFYDDAAVLEFIESNYGENVVELFNRINPSYGAARADLFRYLLMYRCGGVYLDIKASTTRPLRTSLRDDDQYVLSHWRNRPMDCHAGYGLYPEVGGRGEYQQWHIIAAAGHPFLRGVLAKVLRNIEEYVPYLDGVARRGVLRATGPIAYTLAIKPLLDQHPHRVAASEESLGLQYSVYAAYNHHRLLFRKHYTTNPEPVVFGSRAAKLLDTPFFLCRKIGAHSLRVLKGCMEIVKEQLGSFG